MTLKAESNLKIHIKKEALKFSSAHMTVFDNGTPHGCKEALHGHNYSIEMSFEILSSSIERMIPFSDFKSAMKSICTLWDEHVLLARCCPFLKILSESPKETEFLLCNQRYVFPTPDIAWIDADNVTVETLSEEFYRIFMSQLEPTTLENMQKNVTSTSVTICEGPGQGATFSKTL